MALMFIRLPASFLPEEDQGVLLTMVQLPAGSTQEQTQDVLERVNDYFNTDEKELVKSVFTVSGFGFGGQGQNMGLVFVVLNDWDERKADEDKVPAIVGRANMALSQIKEAFVYSFNIPAIVELGSAGVSNSS